MRANESERKDNGAPFLKCTFSPESEWFRKPRPDQVFATVRHLRFEQKEACSWWIGAHGYLTVDFAGMKTTDLRDAERRNDAESRSAPSVPTARRAPRKDKP